MKKGGVLKKPISKGVGIPNLYPYKNEMLDQLERKEKLDDEYRLHLLALKKAQKTLPHGTMESYAQSVQAQVLQFETDTAGQLRPEEIRQAELLMESVGELDPNAR